MSEIEVCSDSEAPEEFTVEEAKRQDEEIRRIRRENEARVAREKKERRRKWAQRFTPKPKLKAESTEEEPEEAETREELVDKEEMLPDEIVDKEEMLPDEIVKFIATNQRKVFTSDSEDEKAEEKKPVAKKRKRKTFGSGIVDLKDIPPPQCVQNSLDFLKQRKMQTSRSSAILNNSNQALRFLSSSGFLK